MNYPWWQSWLTPHDSHRLIVATATMRAMTAKLHAVLSTVPPTKGSASMSVIDDAVAAAQAENAAVELAIAKISGFPAAMDAAVQAALANGATAAQLAPLTDAVSAMKAETQKLVDTLNPPTP